MYPDALCRAIIIKAVEDYFKLLSDFIPSCNDCNTYEIEAFFHSDLYGLMTSVSGDYLIRKIKEEAAKMILEYTVSKEKGSSLYYVCRVGKEKTPLTRRYTTKKKALHKAAEMQGINYKQYMSIRRRDGATCD